MNVQEVVDVLRIFFPGKTIVFLPQNDPKEIICEIKPTALHPHYSSAIAIIDESAPHYHLQSTETYTVIRGKLSLFVDGQEHLLKKGDTLVVLPGQVHWAKGTATQVEVVSMPGWTSQDHILKETS